MPRINILSPHVADLIAAGEVVERPASAVKELIENAMDAGARNITVEFTGGGAELIRVTDDGCGMSAEDAGVAFLRHATSKLADERGLEAIGTLGFRGEALAAISSVSHIELTTRERGAQEGTYMTLEAGDIQEMRPAGAPEGTSIAVRGLFYNTPARRKFLKSDRAEGAACLQAALRCALGRPDVSVRCIRDGREEFFTPGDGRAESAVYALLGRETALGHAARDRGASRAARCRWAASPARRTRGAAAAARSIFFVNGRHIKSQLLQAAVEQAYKGTLLTGRLPALRHIRHAQPRRRGRQRPPRQDGGQVLRRARGLQRRPLRRAGRAERRPAARRRGGGPGRQVRLRAPGRGLPPGEARRALDGAGPGAATRVPEPAAQERVPEAPPRAGAPRPRAG